MMNGATMAKDYAGLLTFVRNKNRATHCQVAQPVIAARFRYQSFQQQEMEQLKTLKQLLDEGFIDSAEYEHRKRQIIDTLTNTSITASSAPGDEEAQIKPRSRQLAQASAQLHQRRGGVPQSLPPPHPSDAVFAAFKKAGYDEPELMEPLPELPELFAEADETQDPAVKPDPTTPEALQSQEAEALDVKAGDAQPQTVFAVPLAPGQAHAFAREPLKPRPRVTGSAAAVAAAEMSMEEKYALSQKIGSLPGSGLRTVLEIVRESSPRSLRMSGDDWAFDLENLECFTLRKLEAFVNDQIEKQNNAASSSTGVKEEGKEEGSQGEEKQIFAAIFTDESDGAEDESNVDMSDSDSDYHDDEEGDSDGPEDVKKGKARASRSSKKHKSKKDNVESAEENAPGKEIDSDYHVDDNDEADGNYSDGQHDDGAQGQRPTRKRGRRVGKPTLAGKKKPKTANASAATRRVAELPKIEEIVNNEEEQVKQEVEVKEEDKKPSEDSFSNPDDRSSDLLNKGKPFKIQVCIYSLARKSPNNKRPFVCSACDKTFSDRSNLIQHLRVHTKEKPYGCTFEGCKKRFAHSASLKEHLNTHTGTKPHVCEWPGCGRSFAQASNLRRHQRIHTGEKPFVCPAQGCGKGFSQNINLKQHVKRGHPELYAERQQQQEEAKKAAVVAAAMAAVSGGGTSSGKNGNGNAGSSSSSSSSSTSTSTGNGRIQIFR